MELSSPAVMYLGVKGAAYVAWCAVGITRLDPSASSPRSRALWLGILRLLLGFGFGVVIWLGGTAVFAYLAGRAADAVPFTVLALLTYLLVYVPVRWVEWGIIELLIVRDANPVATFVAGATARSRGWRAGGIAVSCLADVPIMIAVGGMPLGRFLC